MTSPKSAQLSDFTAVAPTITVDLLDRYESIVVNGTESESDAIIMDVEDQGSPEMP